MKKNRYFWLVGAIASILLFVSSCSSKDKIGDDKTDSPTKKEPTLLQVDAEISRGVAYSLGQPCTTISYNASVSYDGAKVNNAVVTVNGINVPRVVSFTDGWYELSGFNSSTPTYIPTNTYTVSVTYDGKTYTETLKAPGGFTANADYSKVQWVENGKYGWLTVAHLFGSNSFVLPKASPVILTSPQTIPTKAFPTADTYVISLKQQNIVENAFGTLSGDNCDLVLEDYIEWRVTK
jgi:hypothetical protein